jgi:hypothetical protein
VLKLVDDSIGGDDALGSVDVAPEQRRNRFGNEFFGEPAHLGDHLAEAFEVFVELFDDMFCHGQPI